MPGLLSIINPLYSTLKIFIARTWPGADPTPSHWGQGSRPPGCWRGQTWTAWRPSSRWGSWWRSWSWPAGGPHSPGTWSTWGECTGQAPSCRSPAHLKQEIKLSSNISAYIYEPQLDWIEFLVFEIESHGRLRSLLMARQKTDRQTFIPLKQEVKCDNVVRM